MRKGQATAQARQGFLPHSALGVGELDTPDLDIARWLASGRFLSAVTDRHPKILDDLATCPLAPSEQGDVGPWIEWLRDWATRNKIPPVPRILAIAGETISAWKCGIKRGPVDGWFFSVNRPSPVEVAPLEPFEPLSETRRQWQVRVAEWTGRLLEEYKRKGYKKARVKLNPDHFDWLARWAVDGHSINRIARDVKRSKKLDGVDDLTESSRQRVQDAIHRLADLIGIPRR